MGHSVAYRVEPEAAIVKRIRDPWAERLQSAPSDLIVANDFRSVWQSLLIDRRPEKLVFVAHGAWQFSPIRVRILNALRIKTFAVSRAVESAGIALGLRHLAVLPIGPVEGRRGTRSISERLESVSSGAFTIGTVARLDPVKRLDLFAEVVRKSGAEGILVTQSPVERNQRDMARSLAAESSIRVLFDENPDDHWDSIDIFLCSSSSESFGLAHLEAFQAQSLVVSTARNGPADFMVGSLGVGYLPGAGSDGVVRCIRRDLRHVDGKAYEQDASRILERRGPKSCARVILEDR